MNFSHTKHHHLDNGSSATVTPISDGEEEEVGRGEWEEEEGRKSIV